MPGEPFFPERIYHYNCVHLRVVEKPAFVLDISKFWERKLAAIKCFESQFITGRSTEPPTILDRLRDHLATPRTAVECFPVLFKRQIGPAEEGLALVEAVAHLNCLLRRRQVSRSLGPDGAYLWERL